MDEKKIEDNGLNDDEFKCAVPQNSSWNWTKSDLVKRTKNIYIARATKMSLIKNATSGIKPDFSIGTGLASHLFQNEEWTFSVVSRLKGSVEQSNIKSIKVLVNESEPQDNILLHPVLCEQMPRFSKGKLYLIFENSFHSLGYKEIKNNKDPWALEVLNIINEK